MKMHTIVLVAIGAAALSGLTSLQAQTQSEVFDGAKIPDGNCLCEVDMKGVLASPFYKAIKAASPNGTGMNMPSELTGGQDYDDFRKVFEKHGITEDNVECVQASLRTGDLTQMPMAAPGKPPFDIADLVFAVSLNKKLSLNELEAIAKELAQQAKEDVNITRETYKSYQVMCTKPGKQNSGMSKDLDWTITNDGKILLVGFPTSLRGALDRLQSKEKKPLNIELQRLQSSIAKTSQIKILVDLPRNAKAKADDPAKATPAQPLNPMMMGAEALKDLKAFSVDTELSDKMCVNMSGYFSDVNSASMVQNLLSGMLLPMLKMQIPMQPDGKMTRLAETLRSDNLPGTPIVKVSLEMSRQDVEMLQNAKGGAPSGAMPDGISPSGKTTTQKNASPSAVQSENPQSAQDQKPLVGTNFGVRGIKGNSWLLTDPANDFEVTVVNKSGLFRWALDYWSGLGVFLMNDEGGKVSCGNYMDESAHKLVINTSKRSVTLDGKELPYSNRGVWVYGSDGKLSTTKAGAH